MFLTATNNKIVVSLIRISVEGQALSHVQLFLGVICDCKCGAKYGRFNWSYMRVDATAKLKTCLRLM